MKALGDVKDRVWDLVESRVDTPARARGVWWRIWWRVDWRVEERVRDRVTSKTDAPEVLP